MKEELEEGRGIASRQQRGEDGQHKKGTHVSIAHAEQATGAEHARRDTRVKLSVGLEVKVADIARHEQRGPAEGRLGEGSGKCQ